MKRAKALLVLLLCVLIPSTGSDWAHAEEGGVTRLEFYELVMQTMEQKGTITHFGIGYEPFADVSNAYVSEAYALGLVKGDGCGNFNPDDVMTREQAAVALKRVQDYIVPRLIYDNQKAAVLDDRSEIAAYAVSSVALLTMTGTLSGGYFRPRDGADRAFVQSALGHIYNNVVYQPVSHPGMLPTRKTPVLMYHTIAPPPSENATYAYIYVESAEFEEQIRYLAENGYTFLFPDEMYYADHCEKPVVITFDDGYFDNYENAYPVLEKYNAKATIFVTCSNIGQAWMLGQGTIKELADSGLVNIGSHGKTHSDLTSLAPEALQEEMAGSQWLLEQITGKKITNIAYPFGKYNDDVIWQAQRYFACGFSVGVGQECNPYAITRETVDGRADMENFKQILQKYL